MIYFQYYKVLIVISSFLPLFSRVVLIKGEHQTCGRSCDRFYERASLADRLGSESHFSCLPNLPSLTSNLQRLAASPPPFKDKSCILLLALCKNKTNESPSFLQRNWGLQEGGAAHLLILIVLIVLLSLFIFRKPSKAYYVLFSRFKTKFRSYERLFNTALTSR